MLLRERVCAKVLGRDFRSSSVEVAVAGGVGLPFLGLGLDSACGAAAEDGLLNGFPGLEKGLLLVEAAMLVVEKGFAEPNGDPIVLAPKSVSPKLDGGFGISSFGFTSSCCSFFLFSVTAVAPRDILTLRRARMLPSFRRQVLRRHAKTYNRRSWPGKRSGNSPFSCSSNTIKSLQTLQRASAADGGLLGSSHSCI